MGPGRSPGRGSDPQPQSSSLTLPCQILVSVDGCRSLTACGGCVHWTPASSRRPAPRTARQRRAGLADKTELAAERPPLGGRPRGSRVWSAELGRCDAGKKCLMGSAVRLSKNSVMAADAHKQRYAGLLGKCCGTRVKGFAPKTLAVSPALPLF